MILPGTTLLWEAPHWASNRAKPARGCHQAGANRTVLRPPLHLDFTPDPYVRLPIPPCTDTVGPLTVCHDPLPWLCVSVVLADPKDVRSWNHPPHHVAVASLIGTVQGEFGPGKHADPAKKHGPRVHFYLFTPRCNAIAELDPSLQYRLLPRRRPAALVVTPTHLLFWTQLFDDAELTEDPLGPDSEDTP